MKILWFVLVLIASAIGAPNFRRQENDEDLEKIDRELGQLLDSRRDDREEAEFDDLLSKALLEDALNYKRTLKDDEMNPPFPFEPPPRRGGETTYGEKRGINYKHQWKEEQYPKPDWRQGGFGERRSFKRQWMRRSLDA